MIEKTILQLIQTKIIEAVSLSLFPTLLIQALGRSIIPDNSQKYLEIVHFPNNVEGDTWGNSKTYRGIIRHVVSSRAIIMGAKGLNNGLTFNVCENMYLLKGMSQNDKEKLK